jgi:hypothetical protein
MSEQFLNRPEIGASLEQVGRERVPEQVRVHTPRLESGALGEPAQDQEGAGPGEGAALRVEEELGTVAPVEERPPAGEVPAERIGCRPADWDDALLPALARHAHEALVEVDAAFLERDRLGDADARAVEKLDEGPVAQRARCDAGRGRDQPLGLSGRERARQLADAPRQRELGGGVVGARAEELEMPVEARSSAVYRSSSSSRAPASGFPR